MCSMSEDAQRLSAAEPTSTDSDEAEQLEEGCAEGDSSAVCSRHEFEVVRLYCSKCTQPICAQCARTYCKEHEHKAVGLAADEARDALATLAHLVNDATANLHRAENEAMSYLVEMHEEKLAFLRILERRKSDAESLLIAAYDEAVSFIECRVSTWNAAAGDFIRLADNALSQSQLLLKQLDELVWQKFDLSVVASAPVAEMSLKELLASTQLREASLSLERFRLACGGGEHSAIAEKIFALTVTDDKEAVGKTVSNSVGQQRSESAADATAGQLEVRGSDAEARSTSTDSNDIDHLLVPSVVKSMFEEQLSQLTHNDEGKLASVSQSICGLLSKAPLSRKLLHGVISLLFREAALRRDVMPELALLCQDIKTTLTKVVTDKRSITRHFIALLTMHIYGQLPSMLSRIAISPARKRSLTVQDIACHLEFIAVLRSAGIKIRCKPVVLYEDEEISPHVRTRCAMHDCITLCLLSAEHEELIICGCRLLLSYASEFTSIQPGCQEHREPSAWLHRHFARIKYLRETPGLSPNVIALMDDALAYGESNVAVAESSEKEAKRTRTKNKQKERKKRIKDKVTADSYVTTANLLSD